MTRPVGVLDTKPVLAYEREARENERIREAIACHLCHHACEHMFTWVLERTSARFARSGCSVLEHLGSISGHLGASWGILGATWDHFGSILGVYVGLCWGMLAYLKTS